VRERRSPRGGTREQHHVFSKEDAMRHTIEFHAQQLSDDGFGALLRRLAEEVAHTEDCDLTVTGQRNGDEYAARALPVPMGSYVMERGSVPEPNDLVAALWRYYVATERV
jgi:hypothetical protein